MERWREIESDMTRRGPRPPQPRHQVVGAPPWWPPWPPTTSSIHQGPPRVVSRFLFRSFVCLFRSFFFLALVFFLLFLFFWLRLLSFFFGGCVFGIEKSRKKRNQKKITSETSHTKIGANTPLHSKNPVKLGKPLLTCDMIKTWISRGNGHNAASSKCSVKKKRTRNDFRESCGEKRLHRPKNLKTPL